MVQLKEEDTAESTSESVSGTSSTPPRDISPTWPFVLLSIAIALISAGAYQLTHPFTSNYIPVSQPDGGKLTPRTTIPYHNEHDDELYTDHIIYGSKKRLRSLYKGKVYNKEQLSQHGSDSSEPWVAVLGHIFDVTTGKRIYANNGAYNFFSGRDGSKAYSTGDFSDAGLTDDLSGMAKEKIGEIYTWINTFQSKYPLIGRLEGPFFDSTGSPTQTWREIEESLLELGEEEERLKKVHLRFPSCNSHFDSNNNAGEVWCTKKSGGVTRNWVGVPRKFHLPGRRVRCACVQERDLNDPKLQPYPDCPASSTSCNFNV